MSFWPSDVTGSLTATGGGLPFSPGPGHGEGRFSVLVNGTFVATWTLERSFDNGSTWDAITVNNGTAFAPTGKFNEVLVEAGNLPWWRVNVTAYTSGTLTYRFSQR